MATRIRPQIREFAGLMEVHAKTNGLHGDTDQSYLYARAKEGLAVIADDILSDGAGLAKSCANMANIMMLLGSEVSDEAAEQN